MKKKSIFIMMLMSVILSSVSFPAYAATDSFGNKIDWEEDYGYEDAAGSEILKETEIEESTEYSFSEDIKSGMLAPDQRFYLQSHWRRSR